MKTEAVKSDLQPSAYGPSVPWVTVAEGYVPFFSENIFPFGNQQRTPTHVLAVLFVCFLVGYFLVLTMS